MPSVSRAQRRLFGLVEHHPEKVYPENRHLLSMSREQLHDFAATKEQDLPERVRHVPWKRRKR